MSVQAHAEWLAGDSIERNLDGLIPPPLALRSEDEVMHTWEGAGDPEVSIRCATYNHRDYIEDALRGFLGQVTTFPFEIVIRDDASTDGTTEILREYAARYPRIVRTVHERTNRYSAGIKPGFALARLCRGTYVALCEGDDYWLDPYKLQKQRDLLAARPDASCSFHDVLWFEHPGKLRSELPFPDWKRDHSSFEIMAGLCFAHPATLFFRRLAPEVLYPPESAHVVNGDVFRYSILGQYGLAAYAADVLPSAYRHHPGGIWTARDQAAKDASHMVTYFWLAEYYSRLGAYPRVARAWRKRHVKETMRRISLSQQCLLGSQIALRGFMRLPSRVVERGVRAFRQRCFGRQVVE